MLRNIRLDHLSVCRSVCGERDLFFFDGESTKIRLLPGLRLAWSWQLRAPTLSAHLFNRIHMMAASTSSALCSERRCVGSTPTEGLLCPTAVSYTHLTLPTNREV